jgi:hypothetical protein
MGLYVPIYQLRFRLREEPSLGVQVDQRPHWRNFGSYEVHDRPFYCEIQGVEELCHFAIHLLQKLHRLQILRISLFISDYDVETYVVQQH